MADENNKIITTVEIDATQAQQEIAKYAAVASDSTKELEDRLEAKNKQVEIQNALSEQTIEDYEKKIALLEKEGGKEKEIAKLRAKVNKELVKQTKQNANAEKQINKLNEKVDESKSAFARLDKATGGVLSSFKEIATNPIGIAVAAIAGAFKLFQEAIGRSSKASEIFNKININFYLIYYLFNIITSPYQFPNHIITLT